ncbi:hypothetical protein Poli38472_010693 [Pythium oligandrum]|uniref:Uncharacterized protein n=1 Tax=Pythium oligandrum TaxID=41045 RepID=A0A8K1CEB6_PYTOL|nr:hypothetical protein Poli38472_010693 [Pythium oligandrum]|eukprot:TMW61630.1 hypothetical protein Poli38472_010693 [Pythium oligandrum]
MKLGLKNALSRTLGDLDDIKPRIIILNVEVFHALFASYAMQSSSSSLTAVMLIVSDFIHACVSHYDVNKLLTQISTLTNNLQHRDSMKVTSDMSVLDIALLVIEEDPDAVSPIDQIPSNEDTSLMPTVKHLTQIAPSPNTEASLQTVGPSFRIGTYLNVMFRLPNRAYYPAIKNMDDEQLRRTAYTVTAYACFEVVSLILISFLPWRRLRVSVLHQLAFVLEEKWAVVQFYVVMWVAHTVHSSLEHLGVDYSFKFAWVYENNNTISL